MDRSGPSVAIFKGFVRIEIFVSKEIFWIKICHSSKKVFVSFLNFEQTIFRLLTRSFWERFPELQLLVLGNVFMKNNFFEKRVFFTIFFCFEAKLLRVFGKNFTAELTKVHFICSKEQLMENKLFENNRSYSKTTDFQRFVFEIWQEASTELPKLHIICQINVLRKNTFFEQNFNYRIFFGLRMENFCRFFKHFPTFSEEVFYRKITFLFKTSCLFPVNAEISSGYLAETFWQDAQNCISIVQRSIIPGKNSFFENLDFFSNSDLDHILFANFGANFRQLRENCNASFHRNFLKK